MNIDHRSGPKELVKKEMIVEDSLHKSERHNMGILKIEMSTPHINIYLRYVWTYRHTPEIRIIRIHILFPKKGWDGGGDGGSWLKVENPSYRGDNSYVLDLVPTGQKT